MSIWFQDDTGAWPADMPNVLGHAVLHHSIDNAQLHTKAEAEEIAAGLDGAVVCSVVDVTTAAGDNQPTAKTAAAVAEAHSACEEAVNSLQDERAAELNRWHSEADTDGATRDDADVR